MWSIKDMLRFYVRAFRNDKEETFKSVLGDKVYVMFQFTLCEWEQTSPGQKDVRWRRELFSWLRTGHLVSLGGVGYILLLRLQQGQLSLLRQDDEKDAGAEDCSQVHRLQGSEGARDGHLRGQPSTSPLMSRLSMSSERQWECTCIHS